MLCSHSGDHPILGHVTNHQRLGYHRYHDELADENTELPDEAEEGQSVRFHYPAFAREWQWIISKGPV